MRIALSALVLALALAACAGKQQTLTIVNRSPRPIVEYYIYKVGAADHGASRGRIAPEASVVVKLPVGNLEVLAISDLVILDEHTRDKYTASTAIELKKTPIEVIFHDSTQKPPGLEKPNTLGAAFRVTAPPAPPEPPPEDAVPTPPPTE